VTKKLGTFNAGNIKVQGYFCALMEKFEDARRRFFSAMETLYH
jgi:hypothetical protein